jgi:hypothetical protein
MTTVKKGPTKEKIRLTTTRKQQTFTAEGVKAGEGGPGRAWGFLRTNDRASGCFGKHEVQ